MKKHGFCKAVFLKKFNIIRIFLTIFHTYHPQVDRFVRELQLALSLHQESFLGHDYYRQEELLQTKYEF